MTSVTARLAGAMIALGVVSLSGHSSHAQSNFTAEITRKATAREPEDGFCKTVPWSGITRQTYVAWLEGATVGTTKVNKFANGVCEYNEVTRISTKDGRKCVHYKLYSCIPSTGICGTGAEVECKQRTGDWSR